MNHALLRGLMRWESAGGQLAMSNHFALMAKNENVVVIVMAKDKKKSRAVTAVSSGSVKVASSIKTSPDPPSDFVFVILFFLRLGIVIPGKH